MWYTMRRNWGLRESEEDARGKWVCSGADVVALRSMEAHSEECCRQAAFASKMSITPERLVAYYFFFVDLTGETILLAKYLSAAVVP